MESVDVERRAMAEPDWAQRLREICERKVKTVEPGVGLHAGLVLEMLNILREAHKAMAKETERGNRPASVKRWWKRYKEGPRVGKR